jgi:hypothetical protein
VCATHFTVGDKTGGTKVNDRVVLVVSADGVSCSAVLRDQGLVNAARITNSVAVGDFLDKIGTTTADNVHVGGDKV